LDELRDLVAFRIDEAQIFEPGLRGVQGCRRKIHGHQSRRWNIERLRVTPFVRDECQTRLRGDEDRRRHNDAEVMERVRPRYSFHCFSWLRRKTADTETTRELQLRRRRGTRRCDRVDQAEKDRERKVSRL